MLERERVIEERIIQKLKSEELEQEIFKRLNISNDIQKLEKALKKKSISQGLVKQQPVEQIQEIKRRLAKQEQEPQQLIDFENPFGSEEIIPELRRINFEMISYLDNIHKQAVAKQRDFNDSDVDYYRNHIKLFQIKIMQVAKEIEAEKGRLDKQINASFDLKNEIVIEQINYQENSTYKGILNFSYNPLPLHNPVLDIDENQIDSSQAEKLEQYANIMINHLEKGVIPHLQQVDESIQIEMRLMQRFINEIEQFNEKEKKLIDMKACLDQSLLELEMLFKRITENHGQQKKIHLVEEPFLDTLLEYQHLYNSHIKHMQEEVSDIQENYDKICDVYHFKYAKALKRYIYHTQRDLYSGVKDDDIRGNLYQDLTQFNEDYLGDSLINKLQSIQLETPESLRKEYIKMHERAMFNLFSPQNSLGGYCRGYLRLGLMNKISNFDREYLDRYIEKEGDSKITRQVKLLNYAMCQVNEGNLADAHYTVSYLAPQLKFLFNDWLDQVEARTQTGNLLDVLKVHSDYIVHKGIKEANDIYGQ
eukprot:403361943